MAIGIGSVIGGVSALAGIGFGISQNLKANRLEKNNVLPVTKVNSNILSNALQARQMAQIGLSSAQYNNQVQMQQNNLSNVLASASRSGSNIPVAGLLRQANQSNMNLNALDAQTRQQNQRISYQQNSALANEEQRVFNWNKAQPYLRTAQQVASMRNAGTQNIFGGLGTIANLGISGAFDGQSKAQTPNFYNQMSQFGIQNNGNYGGTLS